MLTLVVVCNKTLFNTLRGARAVGQGIGHGMLVAGSSFVAPLAYTAAGLIYVAETGINYRKYKKGLITKKEFKKRALMGAVGKLSAILGTSIGAAAGFAVGTAIAPGVGSIVGVVVGGVSGSLLLRALALKSIKKIDNYLVERKF